MSDWSEPDTTVPDTTTSTNDDAGPLMSYDFEVTQMLDAMMPDVNVTTGENITRGVAASADTPIVKAEGDSKSWFADARDSLWKAFGGSNEKGADNSLARTLLGGTIAAGGALVAGLGKGYSDAQARAQAQKIAEDKLAVEKQLVESQTGIARERMANQAGLINMKFGAPSTGNTGLLYSQATQHPRTVA